MVIEFYKYQATGNDFIVIDDRKKEFDTEDSNLIASLCERKFGIGADGLILLRNHDKYDFEMIYFNSNGLQSSLCGNGARCIVSFASTLGIINQKTFFKAIDGVHEASILDSDVCIKFNDISKVKRENDDYVIDSGSPHYVIFKKDIDKLDIVNEARKIRNSNKYKEDGINVNFVSSLNKNKIRTYERGVENETFSCGTGAVACSVALHFSEVTSENDIEISTRGGVLTVSFEEFNGTYKNIWLTGEAHLVYIGEFEC